LNIVYCALVSITSLGEKQIMHLLIGIGITVILLLIGYAVLAGADRLRSWLVETAEDSGPLVAFLCAAVLHNIEITGAFISAVWILIFLPFQITWSLLCFSAGLPIAVFQQILCMMKSRAGNNSRD